jgi:hypothetical protein
LRAAVSADSLPEMATRRRERIVEVSWISCGLCGSGRRSVISILCHLRAIPITNLTRCHLCYAVVTEDIVKRCLPFLTWMDYSAALELRDTLALTRGMTFSAIRIIDWRPSSRSFQSLPAYSNVPKGPVSS